MNSELDHASFLDLASAVGVENAAKLQADSTPISDDLRNHISQMNPNSQMIGSAIAAIAQNHKELVESKPAPKKEDLSWSFDPNNNTPAQAAINSGIAQAGNIYSGLGKTVGQLTHVNSLMEASAKSQSFYQDYLKQMQQTHPTASSIGSSVGGILSTIPLGMAAGAAIGKGTAGLLDTYIGKSSSVIP